MSFSQASASFNMAGSGVARTLERSGATACSIFTSSASRSLAANSTSWIFARSFARASATIFSLASRTALRFWFRWSSFAAPTVIFKRYRLSMLTPLSPFFTATFQIFSKSDFWHWKPISAFAKVVTSAWDKNESLSLSCLLNFFVSSAVLVLAAAFRRASSLATLPVASRVSVLLSRTPMRCSSFANVFFVSCMAAMAAGGWGPVTAKISLMAVPFSTTKSVHFLELAFASWAASVMAFTMPSISLSAFSGASSLFSRGAPSSLIFSVEASAVSRRSVSSSMNSFVKASCSALFFSSASFFSASRFLCSMTMSMHFLACSRPLSASSFTICDCAPHLGNSVESVVCSSCVISSKFSGVASLSFWMTFLTPRVARCSAAFFSISSFCFLACSSRAFCSASRFRRSCSCLCCSTSLRWASSCCFLCISACICCWRACSCRICSCRICSCRCLSAAAWS
mmetsp:Transcript_102562/g.182225  ORF Transcript_102562/g.182225 Transcript_102562/m.182225 type:complete len:457 (-) Transcript_102562:732-2102(-)